MMFVQRLLSIVSSMATMEPSSLMGRYVQYCGFVLKRLRANKFQINLSLTSFVVSFLYGLFLTVSIGPLQTGAGKVRLAAQRRSFLLMNC